MAYSKTTENTIIANWIIYNNYESIMITRRTVNTENIAHRLKHNIFPKTVNYRYTENTISPTCLHVILLEFNIKLFVSQKDPAYVQISANSLKNINFYIFIIIYLYKYNYIYINIYINY